MIRELAFIAPPFGGSAGMVSAILGGKSKLYKKEVIAGFGFLGYGINFYTQQRISSSAGFAMDLLIRPTKNQ